MPRTGLNLKELGDKKIEIRIGSGSEKLRFKLTYIDLLKLQISTSHNEFVDNLLRPVMIGADRNWNFTAQRTYCTHGKVLSWYNNSDLSDEEKTHRENLAPDKQVFVYPEEFLPEELKNLSLYTSLDRKVESAGGKTTIYVHDGAKLLQIVVFKPPTKKSQIYMRDLVHSDVFYKVHSKVKIEDVRNLSNLSINKLNLTPSFDLDQILKSTE
eukprot:GHVP01029401.1.p1 GENE.GHVP01029401.1~~GHVP01029401.1.p1  ORF type:complete len:212 (+),score=23.63 GHVP01029401.1:92-727(+)